MTQTLSIGSGKAGECLFVSMHIRNANTKKVLALQCIDNCILKVALRSVPLRNKIVFDCT